MPGAMPSLMKGPHLCVGVDHGVRAKHGGRRRCGWSPQVEPRRGFRRQDRSPEDGARCTSQRRARVVESDERLVKHGHGTNDRALIVIHHGLADRGSLRIVSLVTSIGAPCGCASIAVPASYHGRGANAMETGLALLLCARALHHQAGRIGPSAQRGANWSTLAHARFLGRSTKMGRPRAPTRAGSLPSTVAMAESPSMNPSWCAYDTDHAGRERCNVTAWPMQVDSLGWQVDQHAHGPSRAGTTCTSNRRWHPSGTT